MQLKGTYTFQAPRDAVWAALMDPTVLAQALPGGDQLEQIGDNEYRAAMNVRVGPVQGKFAGKVELADIHAPERYRMKVSGTGSAGFVNGEGAITLSDEGSGTLMNYEGDVQVGGKIAGVGQRLIESTARSVIKQGLKVLDEQIQTRLAPPVETAAPEPPPAPPVSAETVVPPTPPSAADQLAAAAPTPPAAPTPSAAAAPAARPEASSANSFASDVIRDVARDLASDYIPPQQQERVFFAALGALAMLCFVMLVRMVQRDSK